MKALRTVVTAQCDSYYVIHSDPRSLCICHSLQVPTELHLQNSHSHREIAQHQGVYLHWKHRAMLPVVVKAVRFGTELTLSSGRGTEASCRFCED